MNRNPVIHAYCRCSTTDQTTEQQRLAIQKAYPEGTHFLWYEEEISGWKGSRSQYDSLREAVIRGRAKEIAACNIARLGRNQREALQLLQLCQDKGVKVKILDSPIDFSGVVGTALFALFSGFAQMDSDSKSMNIKRKFALKKKQDPSWRMHGNVKDTVSEKVKKRAEEVYRMLDIGKSARYVSELLGISEHTIGKLRRLRGKELLTRREYAERFPGWHKVAIDERPALPEKQVS